MVKVAAMEAGRRLQKEKYPGSRVLFLAGSVLRGEGTPYSDLDVVVVYDKLPNAYRESFHWLGWPVEAFVHDPQTLAYFFKEFDSKRGFPILATMVDEGAELPVASEFSGKLKGLARRVIEAGPPRLSAKKITFMRYRITAALEDLMGAKRPAERLATAADLYVLLTDFYLRAQGLWGGTGKGIPRRLKREGLALGPRFEPAFSRLFRTGDSKAVVRLAETVLKPYGGTYFAGMHEDAPAEWRKPK